MCIQAVGIIKKSNLLIVIQQKKNKRRDIWLSRLGQVSARNIYLKVWTLGNHSCKGTSSTKFKKLIVKELDEMCCPVNLL